VKTWLQMLREESLRPRDCPARCGFLSSTYPRRVTVKEAQGTLRCVPFRSSCLRPCRFSHPNPQVTIVILNPPFVESTAMLVQTLKSKTKARRDRPVGISGTKCGKRGIRDVSSLPSVPIWSSIFAAVMQVFLKDSTLAMPIHTFPRYPEAPTPGPPLYRKRGSGSSLNPLKDLLETCIRQGEKVVLW
jgi:hypothetical protein